MIMKDLLLVCVMVGLSWQLTLKEQHQGSTKLKSPCQSGWEAYDNCIPATTNGCGSTGWQAKVLVATGPYAHTFTKCCNGHDTCWDKCAVTDFQAAYDKCNKEFKSCMYKKCKALTDKYPSWTRAAAKATCEGNAYTFYKAVDVQGRTYYQEAIDKHCSCYNPTTKEKKGSDKC